MAKKAPQPASSVPAIRVTQWLETWNQVTYDDQEYQARPEPYFYLFSLPAATLKSLTGVYRRSVKSGTPRAKDPNVQRGHEEERSKTIRDFVQHGYPWCEMSNANRAQPDSHTLLKPGWLPTAIIVNILKPHDQRDNGFVSENDLVTVDTTEEQPRIQLPISYKEPRWEPTSIFPLEVIDGQHRLWAFEDLDPGTSFELPIVAFHGLDRSWQAYLFWSVNVTPKRINRSLAFDLYPLLRREDWLEKFNAHPIYREARSQELVEALWSNPASAWHQRINMLGETATQMDDDAQMVTQAAWIRSLLASFVKRFDDDNPAIGGLFGAGRSAQELTLPWNRAMQAAFLINAGRVLKEAVANTNAPWARHLRNLQGQKKLFDDHDPAFYGAYSLLATDQGIRGLLHTLNDLCFCERENLELKDWTVDSIFSQKKRRSLAATDETAVDQALLSLKQQPVHAFVKDIASSLATYDWRTSSTPDLSDEIRLRQAVFRGSSGYREMRRQLLGHIANTGGHAGKAATDAQDRLGY